MKAQELIDKLLPYKDEEIDIVYYPSPCNEIEIWVGETMIADNIKCVDE